MPDPEPPSRVEPLANGGSEQTPRDATAEAARDSTQPWLARALRSVFGLKSPSVREDLAQVLEGAVGETDFTPEERTMLKNILELRGRRVEDVMVPRADIIAVEQETSLNELLRIFERAGHSRLVAYRETLDNPVGMVHIRDLISHMAGRAVGAEPSEEAMLDLGGIDLSVSLLSTRIIRPVLFAPPSMPVLSLLAKMQATRIHLALVIDEYGGTDGLLSMEDVVEEIVGEIEDEHDDEESPTIVAEQDGSFIADARASFEEAAAVLGDRFDPGEAAEEVDTLGGYVVHLLGRVPAIGETVQDARLFSFEVVDADAWRVKRLRIAAPASDQPAAAEAMEPPRTTASDVAAEPASHEAPKVVTGSAS